MIDWVDLWTMTGFVALMIITATILLVLVAMICWIGISKFFAISMKSFEDKTLEIG